MGEGEDYIKGYMVEGEERKRFLERRRYKIDNKLKGRHNDTSI